MSNSETAKESAKLLFEALGIKRVVCIDDEYIVVTADDIIGLCVEVGMEYCKSLSELTDGINFDSNETVWRAALRKKWAALDSKAAIRITARLEEEKFRLSGQSYSSTTPMAELLDFCELLPLTPQEWTNKKDELLGQIQQQKTLFLFDKDLTRANMGEDGGLTLLRQAIAVDGSICGMLSHHFTRESEYETWKQFITDHNLAGERFLLISKTHLQQDNWPGFTRMLKLTSLNTPCRNLTKALADRMRSGIDEASANVSEISVYDLEDIVFRKSQAEGVWEAETMFRILGLYQKKILRGKANENQNIHDLVSEIRTVLNVRTVQDDSSRKTSRVIQRLEWYEDADELNSHLSPIGLGDIFVKTANSRKYILLCQPCDLMVRRNGSRGYELADVFLAEITETHNKAVAFKMLQFLDPEGQKPYYVNFQKRFAVSLDILDLCAMNSDGKASYTKGEQPNKLLIPSWAERRKKLSKIFDKSIDTVAALQSPSAATIEERLPKASRDGKFVKGQWSTNTITYPIERVGRLSSPFCDDLLSSFCAYLSRPAFGMALAVDDSDTEQVERAGSEQA